MATAITWMTIRNHDILHEKWVAFHQKSDPLKLVSFRVRAGSCSKKIPGGPWFMTNKNLQIVVKRGHPIHYKKFKQLGFVLLVIFYALGSYGIHHHQLPPIWEDIFGLLFSTQLFTWTHRIQGVFARGRVRTNFSKGNSAMNCSWSWTEKTSLFWSGALFHQLCPS